MRCRSAPTRACWAPRSSRARAPTYALGADRLAYLVPASGAVEVNGVRVNARDGAAIRDETELRIVALEDAEIVLVDTQA